MRRIWLVVSLAAILTGCNEGNSGAAEADTDNGHSGDDVETIVNKADAPEVKVNLYAVGEEMTTMTFEPDRIQVPPGTKVNLILMNNAKSEAMIHNAVVINPGAQEEVIAAALEAGPDLEYIPNSDEIIAHTSLAGPGETVEVSFTAPTKKGTYQYICTYPGHSSMKGILIVRD